MTKSDTPVTLKAREKTGVKRARAEVTSAGGAAKTLAARGGVFRLNRPQREVDGCRIRPPFPLLCKGESYYA